MTTPNLVLAFYERIWNAGEFEAASQLLTLDFAFRGSLGDKLRGQEAFLDYVRAVRDALADYHCEILDCVAEGDRAFARMRFSGRHVGAMRGFAPTGREVSWLGAALFRFGGEAIAELWVLGDLIALDEQLRGEPAAG
jgi:steroid delta-isomerase-like uncharacterized protein